MKRTLIAALLVSLPIQASAFDPIWSAPPQFDIQSECDKLSEWALEPSRRGVDDSKWTLQEARKVVATFDLCAKKEEDGKKWIIKNWARISLERSPKCRKALSGNLRLYALVSFFCGNLTASQ